MERALLSTQTPAGVTLNFNVLGKINCYNFKETVCGVIVNKRGFYFSVIETPEPTTSSIPKSKGKTFVFALIGEVM